MNPGKRYLRNTVFALWGVAASFVGLNRLYAAVGTEAPEWRRSLLSLGLREDRQPEPKPELDLATAKDFSKVGVHGDFALEIVGAAQYKVEFVPPAGTASKFHAYQENGYLRVNTDDDVTGGTLHIEMPTLERIDANVPRITVQGVTAKELKLYGYRDGVVTLQNNRVDSWHLSSGDALDVRMDDATFAAGSIKSNGNVVIRRAP